MVEKPIEGLRARKKRAAREAISAAARGLFAERGFAAVTVAEVAAAADVAEKTVFNHFATKEDLVFAGREERLTRLAGDIRRRPAGTTVLEVFRATTAAMIDNLAEADRALGEIVAGSALLRERLAIGWEDEAAALTAAIAESTGAAEDDVVPEVVARALASTHRMVFRAALDGADRAWLRREADRAYDQLAGGLGAYGTAF